MVVAEEVAEVVTDVICWEQVRKRGIKKNYFKKLREKSHLRTD